MLTELERWLLSIMVYEREPLHALYTDVNRKASRFTIEAVIDALLELARMGLIRAYQYDDSQVTAVKNLTRQQMMKHVFGRSDDELKQYPYDSRELWFELTLEGKEEAEKEP